jgi:hypothetical protein
MSNFFATFTMLEIIDLVLSVPIMLFLIALAMAVGISLWRSDDKFHQHIRKMALAELERGTPVGKYMRLSMFYIVFTAILAYIGAMYFSISLGIVAVLMTCFSFYYLAVVEQFKTEPSSQGTVK